ncbi:MAG: hypothetical protein ACYDBZ_12035 [Steroidobacteraceae bacterium]
MTTSKTRSDNTFLERHKRLLQGLDRRILADRRGHESEFEGADEVQASRERVR